MISVLLLELLLVVADAPLPAVRVSLLDGSQFEARLAGLDRDSLSLVKDSAADIEKISLPLDGLLKVDFAEPTELPKESPIHVVGIDGSWLLCQSFLTNGKDARVELLDGRTLRLPLSFVAAALLVPATESAADLWKKTILEKHTEDVLVIRRNNKKFELEGIVGDVRSGDLSFILDGDEHTVNRDRVYSIRYAHSPLRAESMAEILDRTGNRWVASQLDWKEGNLVFRTAGGAELSLPASELFGIDFSRGQIVFLSELEPTEVRHTPFFDVRWDFTRDTNLAGGPIRLGGVEYPRGLVVHSRTVLEYDLAKKFRRFEAVIGIEDSAGHLGDAMVRILADGELLRKRSVRADQPAESISLSVENAEKLILEVDFAEFLDLGDHVVFGSARLVK